jgi:hypothetical protein
MKIMSNGRKTTIVSFVRLANAVKYEESLETLELVQNAGREDELMECLNKSFSDYEYSLVGVEDYLMFEMYNEDTWADLWE